MVNLPRRRPGVNPQHAPIVSRKRDLRNTSAFTFAYLSSNEKRVAESTHFVCAICHRLKPSTFYGESVYCRGAACPVCLSCQTNHLPNMTARIVNRIKRYVAVIHPAIHMIGGVA